MEMIAQRSGRLLKGGEPCLRSAAIMLINDFQRGRLPHYVAPPELKEEDGPAAATATIDRVNLQEQNMDQVGIDKKQEEKPKATEGEDIVSDNEEAEDDSGNNEADETETKEAPAAASLIGDGDWED